MAAGAIASRPRSRFGARAFAAIVALAAAAAAWVLAAAALWRTQVPADLRLPRLDPAHEVGAAALERAQSFATFVRVDWVLAQVALVVVLALYARHGARFARESAAGPVGTGFLLGMLGLGLVWIAQAPFGLAELWWLRRHDLSHQGYVEWVLGNWLGLGGRFAFLCVALAIVMGLARVLRDRWWLVAAPAFVALELLFTFVSPYLISNLHPLHQQALAADARSLARAEGLAPVPVRVEDLHRSTSQPNAEAAGLGPSRRVVLWSTLLDGRFSRAEERTVLAHELGHLSRQHLLKSLGWFALLVIPGSALVAMVTHRRGGLRDPAAVPSALLVVAVLALVATPLRATVSRRYEAEADWIALGTTRDPAAAARVWRTFTRVALSDPDPPGWWSGLVADHPSGLARIEMADAWRRTAGAHLPAR